MKVGEDENTNKETLNNAMVPPSHGQREHVRYGKSVFRRLTGTSYPPALSVASETPSPLLNGQWFAAPVF